MWRVRDRATFQALRRAPRVRRGLLTVAWLDDGSWPPRLAFSISRKVAGAVGRNRLRRRLREVARRRPLPPGAWLAIPAPGCAEVPFANLSSWWADATGALAR